MFKVHVVVYEVKHIWI